METKKGEAAETIAKLCWYTGNRSTQTLAWFIEITEAEVEEIIGSDEHLAAIEKLIRTRPNRKPESIEDWWTKHWKDKPEEFARRMRISASDVSELILSILRKSY